MFRLPAPTADTPALEDLRAALGALTPDTRPAWGKLDALGMARHSARFVDLYAGRVPVGWGTRTLARLIGPLFLRRVVAKSPTETPRDLTTLPALREGAAPEVDPAEFEEARATLDAALAEAATWEGVMDHPLYGRTEAESARTLVRHHTAHHFHQFGLLEPVTA